MIILYRIIINFILIISPIIIILRLIKKKEDLVRFKEKFCFFSEKNIKGKLIWFHGASVGELQSIIPLLEKLEKNNRIKKILVTSNTLSSSKIFYKTKLKKVVHQFFPIDTNFHSKKFLNYWKPSSTFFIDSEIWPNMFLNIKKNNIPIVLLNGRITKKSFSRWKILSKFSNKIFKSLDLCLCSDKKSKIYLKQLGAQNIKFIGNLKYSQSENKKIKIDKNIEKFLNSKKIWCASSTHKTEEIFCSLVHKELKKKYHNLLTVIIPRHIERTVSIRKQLNELNLKIHTFSSKKKIEDNTDILIIDAYGKTKTFYKFCKNVFLGGSIINHGGQNPLEATRYGCNVLHGPNIVNFTEIYNFLKKNNMSQKVKNRGEMTYYLNKFFLKKSNSKKIQKKLNSIGKRILQNTYEEINQIL